MKKIMNLLVCICVLLLTLSNSKASDSMEEKPVQHVQLEDINSSVKAKNVFLETTSEIKAIDVLDAQTMHEIHLITYRLEKSVAYYVNDFQGEELEMAKELAEVVESIHLASENNRKEATQAELEKYFDLAEKMMGII